MKIYRKTIALLGMIAVVTMASPSHLLALTNGFVVPSFRGSASSEAGYWEVFTRAAGAPGNLPDQAGATTDAVLTQTNVSSFLTSGGNIYNPGGISSFILTDSTPFLLGTVVMQARTVGSEIDYNAIALTYTNDTGTHSLLPLFRYELDRGGGQGSASSLWQWDLTGLGVTNYDISFKASGPSMSFDSMTLDTSSQFTAAFAQQPFALKSKPANLARWKLSL